MNRRARRPRGPVLTLLAVLAVGAAVFAVNAVLVRPADQTQAAVGQAAQAVQAAPATDDYGYGADSAATDAGDGAAADGAAATGDTGYGAAPSDSSSGADPSAAAAAPQTTAPVTGTFAGRSAGDEVTVAMGVEGDKVVVYVCDGKTVESWFEGTYNDGKLQLSGVDGDLTADATRDAVLGTVSVGDKSWPFSAQPEAAAGSPTSRSTLKTLGSA